MAPSTAIRDGPFERIEGPEVHDVGEPGPVAKVFQQVRDVSDLVTHPVHVEDEGVCQLLDGYHLLVGAHEAE